ncbi:hypothetical protein [Comamonas antarctica]|uniref:hypothetical protein n=1 Tax=Comamonas antarctica TaxID=2743470 RepID=UPI0028E61BA4|nr:hypothetical protein [Comamonas antarctica]
MNRALRCPCSWLLAALLVLACLALSGCRALAEVWNCPGMTAVWLDESTVRCLP